MGIDKSQRDVEKNQENDQDVTDQDQRDNEDIDIDRDANEEDVWQEKYAAELKKTLLLQNVCSDLREEFEQYSMDRRSSCGSNFINAREVPSKKV